MLDAAHRARDRPPGPDRGHRGARPERLRRPGLPREGGVAAARTVLRRQSGHPEATRRAGARAVGVSHRPPAWRARPRHRPGDGRRRWSSCSPSSAPPPEGPPGPERRGRRPRGGWPTPSTAPPTLAEAQKVQLGLIASLLGAQERLPRRVHPPARPAGGGRGEGPQRAAHQPPFVPRKVRWVRPSPRTGWSATRDLVAVPLQGADGPARRAGAHRPAGGGTGRAARGARPRRSPRPGSYARLREDTARREKDLQTALAGLKSMEKNREELLSNVSHDLKTPLTTVKAYLSDARPGAPRATLGGAEAPRECRWPSATRTACCGCSTTCCSSPGSRPGRCSSPAAPSGSGPW